MQKRFITEDEYNTVLDNLKQLADINKVPVFNTEWEEFTEDQKTELRGWYRGGTWDFSKKMNAFFSHLIS